MELKSMYCLVKTDSLGTSLQEQLWSTNRQMTTMIT